VQAHASANKRTPADAPRLTVPSRDCPRHDMLCAQPALYSACAVMHAVGTENRFSGCKAHMHSTAVNNNHTFCSRWRASTQRRINDCASLRSTRSPKLPKAADTCLQRFTSFSSTSLMRCCSAAQQLSVTSPNKIAKSECVHGCVRACVHACVRLRSRMHVGVHACVCVCVHAQTVCTRRLRVCFFRSKLMGVVRMRFQTTHDLCLRMVREVCVRVYARCMFCDFEHMRASTQGLVYACTQKNTDPP